MSDQPIAPALDQSDATEAPNTEPQQEESPKTFTQEDLDRMAGEIRRREKAKYADYDDAKAKAAEYDKAQDAAKTAEQRAAEQAQKAADDARIAGERADRAELGVEHGIGKDYLDLLGGGTREDMSARAERLAPLLAAQRENEQLKAEVEALRAGKPAPATARPVASLQPGAAPVVVETIDDSYPAHWIPQRAN